ncbi:Hypothetical protein PFR_JS12-1_649 [Propionibacterium freudenreichii]|uniref:DivIVA domain-containing protein n=1 Tax=Propionibacterium freudenreichii TaxID=1744 RepID=UPI000BC31AFB|nr:DivIVA domain-containing protein [Propionibacterium freudenreichii]SBN95031.1 Hypothetical protein PFR_JS12-2_647 [Propionibacterium freudenreichii]SCC96617.1 Hypothetical protein PFR_JS12-1_649 [Propionibacterium freudenreichii]
MVWAIGILIIVAIACGVFAARGKLGELAPAVPDRSGPDLPESGIRADDLHDVVFATVLRGYDPKQVRAAMDVLAGLLSEGANPPQEALTRVLATRFDVVTRGYEMDQVDAVINRVVAQLSAPRQDSDLGT